MLAERERETETDIHTQSPILCIRSVNMHQVKNERIKNLHLKWHAMHGSLLVDAFYYYILHLYITCLPFIYHHNTHDHPCIHPRIHPFYSYLYLYIYLYFCTLNARANVSEIYDCSWVEIKLKIRAKPFERMELMSWRRARQSLVWKFSKSWVSAQTDNVVRERKKLSIARSTKFIHRVMHIAHTQTHTCTKWPPLSLSSPTCNCNICIKYISGFIWMYFTNSTE